MKCPLTEEEVYQPVNEVEAQTGEKLTNNIEELTEDFEKSIEKKELTHT
ncbi:hypothetical protein FACS1894176_06860 [Bacteroidia bacterium]|nr:hypothetical protein FACS1894176_06860 [Bacteroidia bacterium]